jgi:hypothetical protein
LKTNDCYHGYLVCVLIHVLVLGHGITIYRLRLRPSSAELQPFQQGRVLPWVLLPEVASLLHGR